MTLRAVTIYYFSVGINARGDAKQINKYLNYKRLIDYKISLREEENEFLNDFLEV